MTQTATPRQVFHQLVHGVADRRWDDLPGLYAEQTHVVHPLDPLSRPALLSRADLREHFTAATGVAPEIEPANITIHDTTDPEVIVAEFEYQGTVAGTGEPFAVPCIFVLRVRDGQIVSSRDYVDHLGMARAMGQLDKLFDKLRDQPGGEDPRAPGPLDRAALAYEQAVFGGDGSTLAGAQRELDALEADLALARGRLLHAQFLQTRAEDPHELALLERAAELFHQLGDLRGEAEAQF